MTVEWIRSQRRRVKRNDKLGDHEAAHVIETRLLESVLKAIAYDEVADPRAVARAALEDHDHDQPRGFQ